MGPPASVDATGTQVDARFTRGHDVPESSHGHLIGLITGYWASQAVVAAVQTGLVDALAEGPLDPASLAPATGCDPESINRLARYLTTLGVLGRDPQGRYVTTPVAHLLEPRSAFRDLVLLYGEEFYQAWGHFSAAVRTGQNAFGLTFGVEHFDYFGGKRDETRFDRAMNATTELIAGEIGEAFDFSSAKQIVDIGGGNGRLLKAILAKAPGATGILLDRCDVLEKFRPELEEGETCRRISAVAGDFFREVPGDGDVYLLSRILHDWTDNECQSLIRACGRAMGSEARLLIVERVLPEDGRPSLAFQWDMQMLAITGGRERSLSEYSDLLRRAGFQLGSTHQLPLETQLLVASPEPAAVTRMGQLAQGRQ